MGFGGPNYLLSLSSYELFCLAEEITWQDEQLMIAWPIVKTTPKKHVGLLLGCALIKDVLSSCSVGKETGCGWRQRKDWVSTQVIQEINVGQRTMDRTHAKPSFLALPLPAACSAKTRRGYFVSQNLFNCGRSKS